MATFQAYRHPKQHMFLAPKEGGGAFFAQITVGRGAYVIANTPK